MKRHLVMRVNGVEHELLVAPHELLLDVLRKRLRLTGTKLGCGVGICGTCTVHLDGQPVSACLTLAINAEGREVTTIEGLGQDGRLDPLQEAFIAEDAFQCGFCTPGMIMMAKALLRLNPSPTEAEIKDYLSGNLCRCTGYVAIIKAVRRAAEARSG